MDVRIARKEDMRLWNEYVYSSENGSFLQSWEWGNLQHASGRGIVRYVAVRDDRIVGVCLVIRHVLLRGMSYAYIPRGPVAISADVRALLLDAVLRRARQDGAILVRADMVAPDSGSATLPEGWRVSYKEAQPSHTIRLDLDASEEDILANMKSKTRYNVRLSKRKGVSVRFSRNVRDMDSFIRLAEQVSGRGTFQYHVPEYYRLFMSELAGDDISVELALAEHEGDVLAAHLMVYAGSVATYAHGASSLYKRNLMAPALTYWETIKRAKHKGCRTYDFFGVAPPNAGNDHPWHGVTRIKEGFGGVRVSYPGTYDFVLRPLLYTAMREARRVRFLLR